MTPRNTKLDIHDYDQSYENAVRAVQAAVISRKNKNLILDFDRAVFLKQGLSKARRIRVTQALTIMARDFAGMDFDRMDKKDVEELVLKIENQQRYSVWTKQSYKSIIKKFFKWLCQQDNYMTTHEYPALVDWINTNVKKKDKPRVNASDLLTEQEVQRLINATQNPRDRAFMSMLYELGARIGEIGGLRVKDVAKDEHSYIVDLSGKTGHRTPRIVISDAYITAWLNMHPLKDTLDAPLWVIIGNNGKCKHMQYSTFRKLLLRMRDKAGIAKRIYAHLFRHTRATHLLMHKQINEAQAKVYFGWVPDSKMLSEYSHLMSSDVNNAILDIYGVKVQETSKPKLNPRQCPRCSTINTPDGRFCYKCGIVLDVKTAIELDEKRAKSDELMTQLINDPEVKELLVKRMLSMGLKNKLLEDME